MFLGVPSLACHLDNIGPMTAHTRTRPANHRHPAKLHVISAPLATCAVFLFVCLHTSEEITVCCCWRGTKTQELSLLSLSAHEDSGNRRGRTEQDRKGARPGQWSQVLLLDESLTRHFLPGDSDNLSGASSRIGAPPPLPSLPFSSPLLQLTDHGSGDTAALSHPQCCIVG